MKIISLKASNVKRLSAVEITPNGESVIIGGRNEQGKSSVLDAIAMALGGAKLVPPKPIRTGADEAVIEVDLGDYLVTRKFRRATREEEREDDGGKTIVAHIPTGEITSTLTVSSKPNGDQPAARFSSPQQLLDKIMGTLAFDPMAFVRAHGTDQLTILKKVVKLDTSDLDQGIKDLEAKRTQANRDLRTRQNTVASSPRFEDAPATRISVADVTAELEAAAALRDVANAASDAIGTKKRSLDEAHKLRQTIERDIAALEQSLGDKRALLTTELARIRSLDASVATAQETHQEALKKVPDVSHIKRRLTEVEELNRKYDANVHHDIAKDEERVAQTIAQTIEANLEAARAAREARVKAAKFPVDGLAFGDDGVLYDGLPFEQASTAVKLRTSIAIGLGANPTVKVLLIHEGAFLDEDNLALVGKMAEDAGAQVWIERVGTQGVGVVIEDGRVQA